MKVEVLGRTFLVTCSPLHGDTGRVEGVVHTMADITERVRDLQALRATEDRFAKTFHASPDIIVLTSLADGRIVEVNDRLQALTGYTHDEIIGKTTAELRFWADPTDRERYVSLLQRDGRVRDMEVRFRIKSDEIRDTLLSGEIIELSDGKYILGVIRDVTEHKRMERALREKSGELERYFTNSLDLLCIADTEGYFRRLNPEWEKTLGYSLAELKGRIFLDFVHPDDLPSTLSAIAQLAEREEVLSFVNRYRHKDGSYRWIEWRSYPVGKLIYAAARDITERVLTEQALRESEERFATLFRKSPEALVLTSLADNKIMDVNEGFVEVTGYSREEVLEEPLDEIGMWADPEARGRFLAQLRRDGGVRDFEARFNHKSGSIRIGAVSAHVISIRGKEHLLSAFHDITARRRAEDEIRDLNEALRQHTEELSRSESRFRLLAENATDIIWTMDMDLHFTYASPAVTRVRGFTVDEALAQSVEETVAPESLPEALRVFQEELARERAGQGDPHRVKTLVLREPRKDGSLIWTETTVAFVRNPAGQATAILGVTRDVSERVEAQASLRRTLQQLDLAFAGVVATAGRIAEARDPYTAGHQRRVTRLACEIARKMALSQEQVEGLRIASLLHDIGKTAVPAEILARPGTLSELEFSIIKQHPVVAQDILRSITFPWPVAEIVLQHHERLDGSGYPRGLKGDQILVEAKILAVADVVEAMATHRPYRLAFPLEEALDEVRKHRGVKYDPQVVDACVDVFLHERFCFDEGKRAAA